MAGTAVSIITSWCYILFHFTALHWDIFRSTVVAPSLGMNVPSLANSLFVVPICSRKCCKTFHCNIDIVFLFKDWDTVHFAQIIKYDWCCKFAHVVHCCWRNSSKNCLSVVFITSILVANDRCLQRWIRNWAHCMTGCWTIRNTGNS